MVDYMFEGIVLCIPIIINLERCLRILSFNVLDLVSHP